MSDQLVITQLPELENFFKNLIEKALKDYFVKLSKTHSEENNEVKYYTRKELKELLHISYPTIDKYTEKGLLRKVTIGRRVLFVQQEVHSALSKIKALSIKN